MNSRKKQIAAVLLTIVLGISIAINPIAVKATENIPEPAQDDVLTNSVQTDDAQKNGKAPAPVLILPENIEAAAGTTLGEAELPDGWTWVDGSTVLSARESEYAARLAVDDETYDYTTVEGYNAQGHYVERMVPVKVYQLVSTYATQDVAIDEENFPDAVFRAYITKNFDKNKDNSLSESEIKNAKTISITKNRSFTNLAGIQYFTELKTLICFETGLTSLDVGKNTALTYLECYDTKIASLDVSKNTALETLRCNNIASLTSLTVAGASSVKNLSCGQTAITSLDIGSNNALTTLTCSDNANLATLKVTGAPALSNLTCSDTGITSLDVSKNTALIRLFCGNSKIESLDVSKNVALDTLSCYGATYLTTLITDGAIALKSLSCLNTGVTSLDVSNNTALVSLGCNDCKDLATLKVAGAIALKTLNCYNTGIKSLDVSNNPALKTLACYDNKNLTTLTFDGAPALNKLECQNTGITGLDVSNNTAMGTLDCSYCPLAWLNLGEKGQFGSVKKTDSAISVNVTEASFNIEEKFAGIDKTKIKVVSGAEYDSNTGVFTNYKKDTPVVYDYACGKASSYLRSNLRVTMTLTGLKEESAITVTGDLGKNYDGEAVSDTPSVTVSGSTGEITYKWERKTDVGLWEDIDSAPTEAGEYRVTATVAADDDYKEASSEAKEFTISKADNAWDGALAIAGWTYGAEPNQGTAGFGFGTPRFLYSSKSDGAYSETVPTEAGTWYVKAVVDDTDNYSGAQSDSVAFVIEPKKIETAGQLSMPDIAAETDLEHITIKDGGKVLVQGTDFDVTKVTDGSKVTVTIRFKGNYSGTITKTYTIGEGNQPGKTDTDNPSAGQTDAGGKGNAAAAAQTGDTGLIGFWAMLFAVSASLTAFLGGKKRKTMTKN